MERSTWGRKSSQGKSSEMGVWLGQSVQEGRRLESGSHPGSDVIGRC